MKRLKRGLRHTGISLLAAAPVGGFLFGIIQGGDPDPNPLGRLVYGFMMAVQAPLAGGFPNHYSLGPDASINVWPYFGMAFVLIHAILVFLDRKTLRRKHG